MPEPSFNRDGGFDLFALVDSLRSLVRSEKSLRRIRVLLVYLTGQGLVQLLSLSVGLLLLRWLSVDNYAQFSVAFGYRLYQHRMASSLGQTHELPPFRFNYRINLLHRYGFILRCSPVDPWPAFALLSSSIGRGGVSARSVRSPVLDGRSVRLDR